MTRETRQYLSRIRKAQDAILNGKANKEASLQCIVSTDLEEGKRAIITVYAHCTPDQNGDRPCESAHIWFGLYSTEEMEAELAECSKLIGITI
jgi:hypothetical protein